MEMGELTHSHLGLVKGELVDGWGLVKMVEGELDGEVWVEGDEPLIRGVLKIGDL